MVTKDAPDLRGKIVAMTGIQAPYQRSLLPIVKAGAAAILIYRDRTDRPGQTMYYLRVGFDERQLTIPVIEAHERFKNEKSLLKHLSAEGMQVAIWPEENAWKTVNDKTGVQVAFNVVLSLMELAIMLLAIHRLNQWSIYSPSGLRAVGPVCIMLELAAATFRFLATVVDPFYSFRIIPHPFCDILITINLPFQFACGILLTFYWSETLRKSKIQASPFISEYKIAAYVVIGVLFVGELVCTAAREALPISAFNPAYVSQAFYVIVAAFLTVSYIICAYQISQRLKSAKASKRSIRSLTLRFTLSTSGYILFIILTILLIPFFGEPWGFKLILNFVFLSANISGFLQVWGFIPPELMHVSRRGRSTHSSSELTQTGGTTE
jgi:hypothetical protein